MRTKLYTILIMFLVTANVFAQKLDREKIKALKIAHITEQLDLTEAEAQKFWPIYNANEEAEDKLREQSSRRKDKKNEDLSESEAKTLLLKWEKSEKQKLELKSKMLNELLAIMPAKKVIKLYQAERSFRHKMIDEYKKRHSKEKRNRK